MTTGSTTEDIVANADYHNTLLRTLSETEYASTAIKQHDSYVQDLEHQLEESNRKIQELAKATTKERKEHERLRDSTARRFAARLSGKKEKFAQERIKEEQEYVAALQAEMIERESNAMLQNLLAEARSAKEDLAEKSKRAGSIRAQLDSLYARIFDGPSESFPEEDKLEYDVHEAHKRHQELLSHLNVESQAAELLARAVQHMDSCYAYVKKALEFSSLDMWSSGPGPSFSDLYERDALANATAQANQVRALVAQARRINPLVQPVGEVRIPTGNMADVWFDNVLVDLSFHRKIEACKTQVYLANNRLKQERDAALHRSESLGQDLLRRSQTLDDLRKELYDLRKAIFESVAASAPKPPSYDNATGGAAEQAQGQGQQSQSQPGSSSIPNTSPPAFKSNESLAPIPEHAQQSSSHGTAGPSSVNSSSSLIAVSEPSSSASLDPAMESGSQTQSPGVPGSHTQSHSPRPWGSRNPYAAVLNQRTRSMSSEALDA